MADAAQPVPPEVYVAFSDMINQASVQRIINGFGTIMAAPQIKVVHLFFHSTGGGVGDGVALHNYFKALPLDLVIYNPGVVASIAVIAYLGAKTRKTSANAVFMLHRTRYQAAQPTQAGALELLADAATLDDRRTEEIIKSCTAIPKAIWSKVNDGDVFLSAQDAVKYGIAQEIGDFSPPVGTRIYNF